MAPYSSPFLITERVSNNALSYDERASFHEPALHVAALKQGWGMRKGEHTAFEEVEEGKLLSCKGLEHFLRLYHPTSQAPITIVDNHNHALYFWLEAYRDGAVGSGVPLIHVDQHKDMRDPGVPLPQEAFTDAEAAFRFTNRDVNVGNFIVPALKAGLISEVHMLDSDTAFASPPLLPRHSPFILDIDIDVFAPDLAYMDRPRMRRVIADLFSRAACVTIATSPYFISFEEAKSWTETVLADAGILR